MYEHTWVKKPYQCGHCGKCFKSKTELDRHERTHTGEEPYKCRSCDRTFKSSSYVRKHEKTHKNT